MPLDQQRFLKMDKQKNSCRQRPVRNVVEASEAFDQCVYIADTVIAFCGSRRQHRAPLRGSPLRSRPSEDSAEEANDSLPENRQHEGKGFNRLRLLLEDRIGLLARFRRLLCRLLGRALLLQLPSQVRRKLLEHFVRHFIDHPGAKLRQDAYDIDLRNRSHFASPTRQSANFARHLHRSASPSSYILAFAHHLDLKVFIVEAFDVRLTFVIGNAWTDLDLNQTLVGTIIDCFRDLSPRHAICHAAGIAEKPPDFFQWLLDLKGLFDLDRHTCYSAIPFSFRIRQIFHGAIGISMCRIPRCERASTTAFTKAAGDPTFGDSPTPFAPSG